MGAFFNKAMIFRNFTQTMSTTTSAVVNVKNLVTNAVTKNHDTSLIHNDVEGNFRFWSGGEGEKILHPGDGSRLSIMAFQKQMELADAKHEGRIEAEREIVSWMLSQPEYMDVRKLVEGIERKEHKNGPPPRSSRPAEMPTSMDVICPECWGVVPVDVTVIGKVVSYPFPHLVTKVNLGNTNPIVKHYKDAGHVTN